MKCVARNNMCSERIKLIDKKNKHAVCALCNEIETWEHATLYEKQKEKRVECLKNLKIKFDAILMTRKATANETNVVREMKNYIGKCFNKEENFWTNR